MTRGLWFDMAALQRRVMPTRTALTLATLMVTLLLAPMAPAADSTVTVDTTWSGTMSLTGNVTVDAGATLTIEPGTTIDAGTYGINVEGTLNAEGASFYSTQPPLTQGSHGQGLWTGLVIAPSGTATLSDVTVSNASAGILVEGTLSATNLELYDAYRGLAIAGGAANVDGLTAQRMDYEAIYLSTGELDLANAFVHDAAVALEASGNATVVDLTIQEVGIGVRAAAGSIDIQDLGIINATVGIASQSGASVDVSNMIGSGLALAFDASNVDGFSVTTAQLSGQRLLVANDASSFELNDVSMSVTSADPRYVLDARCSVQCEYTQLTLLNASKAVSLSGVGHHMFDGSTIAGTTQAVAASGAGTLSLENTNLTSQSNGLNIQNAGSTLDDVHVHLTSSQGVGVDVLGGTHDWNLLEVVKAFQSGDSTSVGVNTWYADTAVDTLKIENMSTALRMERSTAEVTSFTAYQGSNAGLHLINSDYSGTSLSTTAQDEGVTMEGTSHLQMVSWTGQLHKTPLSLGASSTANIRYFNPMNTAATSSDALGDGTLHYGSNTTPVVAVGASYLLEETSVTFTDQAGQPVIASVEAHGFHLMSNSDGAAILPLISGGSSTVDVTYLGTGLRVSLTGGQLGQSVQIPVIPSGTWVLQAGQNVLLGPRPDGQPHQLTGDLVVSENAHLVLKSTTLIVPLQYSVTVEVSGQLEGQDAILNTTLVEVSNGGTLGASGLSESSLRVEGNVSWVCTSSQAYMVDIIGALTVEPGCDLTLERGAVPTDVTVRTGGHFEGFSWAEVHVLDKGEPVQGAFIGAEGTLTSTDENGVATFALPAISVDDSGSEWSGIITVTMMANNLTDYISWDTNTSLNHAFMVSTLPTGTFDDWLVLERRWSPYMLADDLLISSSATMTVQDGVSLRATEGTTITVEGVLDAGDSTLSSTGFGARWGGLVLGDAASAYIDLAGTDVVEAAPAVTVSTLGNFNADDAHFARSGSTVLVDIQTGSEAEVTFRNAHFQDAGGGCIQVFQSTGTITITNSTMSDCGGTGLWARQADLSINGLGLGGGLDDGLSLTGVTGHVSDVDATSFEGTGALIVLESIQGNFQLENVHGTIGAMGGIIGAENRQLDITGVILNGAPAIDLDASAGTIRDVVLTGNSAGTALMSHHGRSMDSLVLENVSVSGYAVGLGLHLDAGEVAAPIIVRSSSITASTPLASEGYDARMEGTNLIGTVELYGAHVDAVDGVLGAVDATEEATLTVLRTLVLDAQLNAVPQAATFTLSFPNSSLADITVTGTTVDVEVPLRTISTSSDVGIGEVSITAQSAGAPPSVVTISPASTDTTVVIPLIPNQAPTVTLSQPYSGQRTMESESLMAAASVSDDLDDVADLVISWSVYDMQGTTVLQAGNEPMFNITDLAAGYYVIEVTVQDTYGLTSTDSVDIEYTLLDTDLDWLSTCSSDTWWDATNARPCGPNVYDEDDDNDGFTDAKDAFPMDACARLDTDRDGQPDDIDCPDGQITWLTADMDDDGDGVPDSLEGVSQDTGSDNINALVLVLVIFGVVLLLFVLRVRRGGPGEGLTGLDQTHF